MWVWRSEIRRKREVPQQGEGCNPSIIFRCDPARVGKRVRTGGPERGHDVRVTSPWMAALVAARPTLGRHDAGRILPWMAAASGRDRGPSPR